MNKLHNYSYLSGWLDGVKDAEYRAAIVHAQKSFIKKVACFAIGFVVQ